MPDVLSETSARYTRKETFSLTRKGVRIERLDTLDPADRDYVISHIRTIPDFPKDQINFRDFIPAVQDGKAFSLIIEALIKSLPVPVDSFDYIGGLEARGFLLGAPLALKLGKGFLPFRKAGKLPPQTLREEYALEYGKAAIEIEDGELTSKDSVLIVDDLIATGGTASAAAQLVERTGAKVAGFSFLMMLDGLNGRELLKDYPTSVLLGLPA